MAKLKDDQIKWILSLDAKGVQSELVKTSSASQKLTDDNKKLQAELKKFTKDMNDAEKAMDRMEAKGDTTSKSYQRAKIAFDQSSTSVQKLTSQIQTNNNAIKQNNVIIDEMVKTLKIEDMTMIQLIKTAESLEYQLKRTAESTSPEAYKALNDELNAVKDRMAEVKGGTENTEKVFPSLSGTAVKSMAAVGGAVLAAKKGLDIYESVMMSNRSTAVEFTAVMDGLSASFDYFKTSVANWSFDNFWENAKKAFTAGSEASKMFENVHNMQNSFKLTSGKEIAEIEELKTQLRDVNLSNKERLEIGNQIIERTKTLAKEEEKIYKANLDAAKRKLDSQAEFTDAELDFILVNRNAQEENLENLKQIGYLEKDLDRLRKNRDQHDEYANGGSTPNTYYQRMLIEDEKQIKKYEDTIEKAKAKYGFENEEQYQLMSSAVKKFADTDKEAVDSYVEARVRMNEVDIKTTKELRQTHRLIDSLKKKDTDLDLGGSTPEQRQQNALNKLNLDLEIKHQNEIARIKQEYKDRDFKDEAKHNREVAVADSASYATRKLALEEFLKNPLETKVRQDVQKQLAEIDNKILDQEVTLRKNIEKILLDADPVAKENQNYEQRLSALELFGIAKENMTADQLKAVEVLEQQHTEKLEQIQRQADARKKAQSEKEFEEGFSARREELQLELNDLMQIQAATGKLGFNAEMEVHMKRLQMLQEEVQARRDAGLAIENQTKQIGRVEAQMTNTIKKENDKRTADYNRYATSIATATEGFFSGQQSGLEAFGGSMIDIMFDILSQIINQKIVEATAVAVAEQAKAAAIAAAMPDSVFTFGASAAARTAAIGAIIMGALQVAKGALKGMIGKKGKNNSNSPSGGGTSGSGSIKVNPRSFAEGGANAGQTGGYTGAGGRYDVAGMFDNGALYHKGEYIIATPELMQPSVLAMVRSIEGVRRQRTNANPMPGSFAEGGGNSDYSNSAFFGGIDPTLVVELKEAIEAFNKKKLSLGASEVQADLDEYNKGKQRFSQNK